MNNILCACRKIVLVENTFSRWSQTIDMLCIYMPPHKTSVCLDDVRESLHKVTVLYNDQDLIIAVPLNWSSLYSTMFLEILSEHNLRQYNPLPTQENNVIDLILANFELCNATLCESRELQPWCPELDSDCSSPDHTLG